MAAAVAENKRVLLKTERSFAAPLVFAVFQASKRSGNFYVSIRRCITPAFPGSRRTMLYRATAFMLIIRLVFSGSTWYNELKS